DGWRRHDPRDADDLAGAGRPPLHRAGPARRRVAARDPRPMTGPARGTPMPFWVPAFNAVARPLLRAGVPMGPDVLLTVRGRTSGLPRTTPVTLCEWDGRRGIISPFGEVQWVRNLRAAGRATMRVGRRSEQGPPLE